MDTGTEKYTDLQECVTKLLQVQADYESARIGHSPKAQIQLNYK